MSKISSHVLCSAKRRGAVEQSKKRDANSNGSKSASTKRCCQRRRGCVNFAWPSIARFGVTKLHFFCR